MGYNHPERRNRRLALALSGSLDTLLGAVLVLFGLGLFPVRPDGLGIPAIVILAIGAAMFVVGAWVAVYNYTRLDE